MFRKAWMFLYFATFLRGSQIDGRQIGCDFFRAMQEELKFYFTRTDVAPAIWSVQSSMELTKFVAKNIKTRDILCTICMHC